jgi:uncharacterized protein
MNRRTFIKRSLIAAPLATGAVAGYGKFIERHAVEVVRLEMSVGIPEPLTIAFVSDFHFDPLYETEYLTRVLAILSESSPDMILYGGDFLSSTTDRFDELLDILRTANAPLGTYAVLGNHDQWINANVVSTGLASCGITVLRNQSLPLARREQWFLTGLESYWSGAPNTLSIENTRSDARHILLVHEPDSFDLLTDPRIVLQLSGHTHGGQIRVPFAGAIHVPSWGKNYTAGLYSRDGRRLYVNRGIGTVGKHFRVNCRPEITLLTLT